MADIKTVKKGLEVCISTTACTGCPYEDPCHYIEQRILGEAIMRDALELLKDQQKWNFFTFRKATDEEKERYIEEYGNEGEDDLVMIENVPGDGEEVLVWTGKYYTLDTYDDGALYGWGEIEPGMAWRYPPEPPKDGGNE